MFPRFFSPVSAIFKALYSNSEIHSPWSSILLKINSMYFFLVYWTLQPHNFFFYNFKPLAFLFWSQIIFPVFDLHYVPSHWTFFKLLFYLFMGNLFLSGGEYVNRDGWCSFVEILHLTCIVHLVTCLFQFYIVAFTVKYFLLKICPRDFFE